MHVFICSFVVYFFTLTFPFSRRYRFPSRIDFKKCREEIASALNDIGNRWCKREYVEPDALKEWKISIFKIVDQRIKFYS